MAVVELYDLKRDNESNQALDNHTISVADDFTGTANVSATFTNAPAGEYILSYNFVLNYNGQKDKAIFWQSLGTYSAAIDFSETISAADTDSHKNRAYGTRIIHSTSGDIVNGLEFCTKGNDFGAILVSCDVSITRVSNL